MVCVCVCVCLSFCLSVCVSYAQLMPLPLTVSCSSKFRLVLPFWYRLTRVDPDRIQVKRAVKRLCVSVCVCVFLCVCHTHTSEPCMQKRLNRSRCVWGQTRVTLRNYVLDRSDYWRHLANTIKESVLGGHR